MSDLTLVIGTPNASSWSLRPWLLLKHLRLPFTQIVIPLQRADTAERIRAYSPSGKVPVLLADGRRIWDSLAIAEYLAESHADLWPADRGARALARSFSSEMHSSFGALRTFLPMDFTARFEPPGRLLAPVERDIARIVAIWGEARRAASGPGPFLFGDFTIADAMFAPVCSRFATYAVPLPAPAQSYVDEMMELPAMREWDRLAQADLNGESFLPERPVQRAAPIEPWPRPAPASPPPPEPAAPPAGRLQPAALATHDVLQHGPRPIPSTIMVKPIGDGTRRRR